MSIKSNLLRDANGNIIIHMQGSIDYENGIPFRGELTEVVNENPNAFITLDLGKVDFVGSSGICHFVETLKYINTHKQDTLSLTNVRSEFFKVFKLYKLDEEDIIMEHFDMQNDDTFNLNTAHGNRKHTFEN
jgi:anti-sigma B factor antagonist